VVGVDVLILTVIEAGLDHAFLNDSADCWAGVSVPGEENVTEEEVGKSSFKVEVEGVVERDKIINSAEWQILHHRVLLGISLYSLGQKRGIVLAIVLAESDGLVDFSLSVRNRLAHLKGHALRCLLESLLDTISQFLDDCCPLLNAPSRLYLEGLFCTIELEV
jgi:hypothetical protein